MAIPCPTQSMSTTMRQDSAQAVLSNFSGLIVRKYSCRLPRRLGFRRPRTATVSLSHGERNCAAEAPTRECGLLEMANSRHLLQRPAEELHINDSLVRLGIMIACPPLGLSVFDSNAVAAVEFNPISSPAAMSADMLMLRSVSIFGDLDPGTAQLISTFAGPLINIFNIMFIIRIVMSWYPGIPVEKFPFFLVYNPTEPVLGPTRRLIPPVGGVDIAPVIWVAVMSFANEILLGKQGLLVLLSQESGTI